MNKHDETRHDSFQEIKAMIPIDGSAERHDTSQERYCSIMATRRVAATKAATSSRVL